MANSLKLLAVLLFVCVFVPTSFAVCPWPSSYTLEFGAFGKDIGWLAAVNKGFFAAQNICVNYNQVANSTQQFQSLASGQYDIISTAVDNVANRIVNENAQLAVVGAFDLGVGLDLIVNTTVISSWEDLATQPILVDAPNSGFVLALEFMARANGITLNPSQYVPAGGVFQRFQAMQAGVTPTGQPAVATMVNNPFTVKSNPPLQIFAKFSDYVAPFQNLAAAVNTTWLANPDHQEALIRFLAAWSNAQKWILNPTNRDEVIALLQAPYSSFPTALNEAQAGASYAEITYRPSQLNRNCIANKRGLQNVVSVRQSLGGFPGHTVNVKKFVRDQLWLPTYCHAALQRSDCDEDEDEGIYN